MKEHVHGFAPGHCQHGLFPELATNNFPLFQTKKLPSQGFFPPNGAAASMSCLPNDTWRDRHFLAGNTAPNPLGRLESPFHLRTWSPPRWPFTDRAWQMSSQAAGRFDAAKQHRRSIRRFADHGSVQWPLLYGPETVRVPTGNAVKVSPTFFVGVSLPDIFFARRSPLTSASGHGCHCDRTNVSYLEHDASDLTDPQCTTTGHSSASHANDNNANTTTDHCFNLRLQHATMPSTRGALRSSWVLTSKSGHWVASQKLRCHDAVRTTAVSSPPPWHA